MCLEGRAEYGDALKDPTSWRRMPLPPQMRTSLFSRLFNTHLALSNVRPDDPGPHGARLATGLKSKG